MFCQVLEHGTCFLGTCGIFVFLWSKHPKSFYSCVFKSHSFLLFALFYSCVFSHSFVLYSYVPNRHLTNHQDIYKETCRIWRPAIVECLFFWSYGWTISKPVDTATWKSSAIHDSCHWSLRLELLIYSDEWGTALSHAKVCLHFEPAIPMEVNGNFVWKGWTGTTANCWNCRYYPWHYNAFCLCSSTFMFVAFWIPG